MKFRMIDKILAIVMAILPVTSLSIPDLNPSLERVYAYAHNEALVRVHLKDDFFYLDRMDEETAQKILKEAERASQEVLLSILDDPELLEELNNNYPMLKAQAEEFGRRQIAEHAMFDHDLNKTTDNTSLLEVIASDAIKEGGVPTGFLQRVAIRAVYQPATLEFCLDEDTESLMPFDSIPTEASICQKKMAKQVKRLQKKRAA